MKLATLECENRRRLVAVAGEAEELQFLDLQACDAELPNSLRRLLAMSDGIERAAAALAKEPPAIEGRLLAPIPDPGKVICIGLNYRDHAAESGMAIPEEPVCFSKFGNAIIGPEQAVRIPSVCRKVDYEAELVAVIGSPCRRVSVDDALGYVAGYMNGNDVSARDWQLGKPGGQWLLGKTPDTFAPIGPWLVTADEIADPHDLAISLRLNGQTMQQSRTRELIFGIDRLIAYLSQLMTLEPGDLIFTGTPPGVGMARKPPVFLKPGDLMEVEIEGLGVLRNPVEAEEQP